MVKFVETKTLKEKVDVSKKICKYVNFFLDYVIDKLYNEYTIN